jgi:hypothetical protein
MPCVLSYAILLGFGIRLIPVRILATSGQMPSVRAPHSFNGSFRRYGSVSVMPKTTIKTDITPDGRDLEATMTAIVTNFLHSLFAANEDLFVILMFIMVGMVLSICLTLGLGPAPPMG